jgi:hypothetical protein
VAGKADPWLCMQVLNFCNVIFCTLCSHFMYCNCNELDGGCIRGKIPLVAFLLL